MNQVEQFLRYCEDVWKASRMPGLAIGVYHEGQSHFGNFGSPSAAKPNEGLSERNLFRVGSITKTFTANLARQLHAEGKIDINAPVSMYLPEFGKDRRNRDFDDITVFNLMTHSGGWYDRFSKDFISLDKSKSYMLDIVNRQPRISKGIWNYCNTGFALLGYVIEKADGVPYSESVQKRILDPLGMDNTFCMLNGISETGLEVDGHYPYLARSLVCPKGKIPFTNYAGAGCIISCTADALKYLRFLLNGPHDHQSSLPRGKDWEFLTSPQIPIGGMVYAAGPAVNFRKVGDVTVAYSNGDQEGQYTSINFIPGRDFGLAVFTTAGLHEYVCSDIRAKAVELFFGSVGSWPAPDPGVDLTDYVGKFQDVGEEVSVFIDDGLLKLRAYPRALRHVSHLYEPGTLKPFKPDHFYFYLSNIHNNSIDFVRDAQGKINGIRKDQVVLQKDVA